ncbi:hypothetical protein [Teredinibacter franksiae]|uniref:hypothetical protein n=1 Tax=Teredinibacter franksiae TaxID=2761453 RepID=UPI0016268BB2|nr:hypothetical protein [Teredinibacter franksiae]
MLNQLKNKHFILAMFIAPVLAIIAYLAVDYKVSEKPKSAIQGGSYKLAANSNCRYQSGICTLRNADVKINIRAERKSTHLIGLTLISELPLQNVVVALYDGEQESPPERLASSNSEAAEGWYAEVKINDPAQSYVRLAAQIEGATYYAEVPAVFVDFETSFERDNFAQKP